jgi:hypothetical protein
VVNFGRCFSCGGTLLLFIEDMSTQTVTLKQVTWDTGQGTLSGIVTVTPALTKNFVSFTLRGEMFSIPDFKDVFTVRFSYSGSDHNVKDLFQPGALLRFTQMESFEIELLASGEIFERTRAVGHFIAYFSTRIKDEWGDANGPIASIRKPPGLQRLGQQKPEDFQHILVNIVPRMKDLLAEFLVWYINNQNMTINISRPSKGATTTEVPPGSVSVAKMEEILDSM